MNPLNRTLIITSGAYIESQLEAEFGKIPPSFLPLGGIRLYQHQNKLLKPFFKNILISLPADYKVPAQDLTELNKIGMHVIYSPISLSLGESILYVLKAQNENCDKHISILHGDTLIENIDFTLTDVVSIAPSQLDYQWGRVVIDNGEIQDPTNCKTDIFIDEMKVLSGWFSFGSKELLINSIEKKNNNFLDGLFEYSKTKKLISLEAKKWFDFGHSDTYYQSKKKIKTQRFFNELEFTKRSVKKTGNDANKIDSEAKWFENLPLSLKIYTPALVNIDRLSKRKSYSLEYLHFPTLAELFVFGNLENRAWSRIFDSIAEIIEEFSKYKPTNAFPTDFTGLYKQKTLDRINDFSRTTLLDMNSPCRLNGKNLPSIIEMINLISSSIPNVSVKEISMIHGDLCFSNLFYDHRSDLVLMIDPRGVDLNGNYSMFGDRRYDLAKLYHSALGLYDYIIAGHFKLNINSKLDFDFEISMGGGGDIKSINNEFIHQNLKEKSLIDSSSLPISILLFFSMLPLHADNTYRQNALLANAMRLFIEWENKN
jgi:hypothetical protein